MSFRSSEIPAPPFEMGVFARAPKFPARRFTSQNEFQDFLANDQGTLDARYDYEQSLATREQQLVQQGTCAPCLRSVRFSSGTEGAVRLPDGRLVPNFREGMRCDCEGRLNNRQRALLHFVQATCVLPWARLLLLAAPGPVDAKLAAMVSEIVPVRPFVTPPETNCFHMAVSDDYLQHLPQLGAALALLCAGLMEGGRFIFTVPFHQDSATSVLMDISSVADRMPGGIRGDSHKLGWDMLDMLRAAGFREAAAYLYWSEELGYLGPMNFIFRAVK